MGWRGDTAAGLMSTKRGRHHSICEKIDGGPKYRCLGRNCGQLVFDTYRICRLHQDDCQGARELRAEKQVAKLQKQRDSELRGAAEASQLQNAGIGSGPRGANPGEQDGSAEAGFEGGWGGHESDGGGSSGAGGEHGANAGAGDERQPSGRRRSRPPGRLSPEEIYERVIAQDPYIGFTLLREFKDATDGRSVWHHGVIVHRIRAPAGDSFIYTLM